MTSLVDRWSQSMMNNYGTPPLALASGAGRYRKFTWDRRQTQAAFLTDRDDAGAKLPRLAVYRWDRRARATRVMAADAPGIPAGAIVSARTLP